MRWHDLNEKRSPMEQLFLNICFTVGAVLQDLEGTALLEEVCHWTAVEDMCFLSALCSRHHSYCLLSCFPVMMEA